MKRSHPNAFTMVEILVVIIVMLVLLAIGVGIGSYVAGTGERMLTQTVLENAMLMHDRYEQLTGSTPAQNDWGTTQEFITNVRNEEPFRSMLATLPESVLRGSGNNLSLQDGWANELHYNTTGKMNNWLPKRDAPYFASEGPDGEFGNYEELLKSLASDNFNEIEAREAEDNIYSFEVAR